MPTRSPLHQKLKDQNHSKSFAGGFSSRHFLKLIEDTGEVGFWSADLRTDRLNASVGLCRILGVEPFSEMSFFAGLDMIHPDDRAAHADQLMVLRSGQPICREFRIIRPDRTQRWILHKAEVILGPDGRPSHGIGLVFDVTTRHDSIRSIEQRHDRFNALLAATAAVVWVVSPDGEALEMPLWQNLTGQSHSQMQGLGWLDALHPDDREPTAVAWRTAVALAEPYNTDYRILCADGVYRWFNGRGVPIRNRDGSIREWIGVCLSIPGENRYGASRTASARGNSQDGTERHNLTAAQIRAARGMAGLSKDELARRANVSISTIARMEDDKVTTRPRRDTVLAVREVFQQAGVEFSFDNNALPGVRPAKSN